MENYKLEGNIVGWGVNQTSLVEEVVVTDNVKLPADAPARMKTLKSEGKKWYLTTVYHSSDDVQPFALFCQTNCHEKTITTSDAVDRLLALARSKGILEEHVASTEDKISKVANVDKLTRSISLLLRHGVLVKNVVSCLDDIEDIYVGSFLFAIKKFLSAYIRNGDTSAQDCSSCGGVQVYSEGCLTCRDCGHSKCG